MAPALALTTGTQRQPEEQAESYQGPSASSSVPPAASSHLNPSVSRPIVAPAAPVHQPAPGYSDPHGAIPAAVPDQSLPYPVPVSGRDSSLPVQLPASTGPSSGSSTPAVQNNPSTDAVSETTQVPDQSLPYPVPVSGRDSSLPVPLPASTGPSSGSPIPAVQNNPSTDAVSETTQVPDQSLPYPVPVSGRDSSLPVPLPASTGPSSGSPIPAVQNNPSTDAVSETTQSDSREVPGPANGGDLNGQDITDHGTDNSTRTSVSVDSALRSELRIDGRFLDPEKYEPVKLLGSGGFAKVIYRIIFFAFCCEKGSSMLSK